MPLPLGPISAAHSPRRSSSSLAGEQRVAGVADECLVGAQDDVAAGLVGCQAGADARRAVAGQLDGVDLADGLDHVQRAVGVQVHLGPLLAAAQRQDAVGVDDRQVAGQAAQQAQRPGVGAGAHPVALDEIDLVAAGGLSPR